MAKASTATNIPAATGEPEPDVTIELTEPMSGAKSWHVGDTYTCGQSEADRMIGLGRAKSIAA